MSLLSRLYKLICILSVSFLVAFFFFSLVFDVPDFTKLVKQTNPNSCLVYDANSTINIDDKLNISVWNIYKLQKSKWDLELTELSKNNQIILLQEAISSKNLLGMFSQLGWHQNQVYAFARQNQIAGVMTLSQTIPNRVCAFRKPEPYLRLPKTAMVSYFPLSNKKQLAVINIHSINFTLQLNKFTEQITDIVSELKYFNGPIIFAGDFNTWSKTRLNIVKRELDKINLVQSDFSPDQRLRVFSYPLDHIFYRGLVLESARSQSTDASDHAWLEATFSFK